MGDKKPGMLNGKHAATRSQRPARSSASCIPGIGQDVLNGLVRRIQGCAIQVCHHSGEFCEQGIQLGIAFQCFVNLLPLLLRCLLV